MNKKKKNIFQSWGSYLGLMVSFIVILQVRVFRVLITEGNIEENYICNLLPFFSCTYTLIVIIIVILVTGFIGGGVFQNKGESNSA